MRNLDAILGRFLMWCAIWGLLGMAGVAHAEDGYGLWLRRAPLPQAQAVAVGAHLGLPEAAQDDPQSPLAKAREELRRSLPALVGAEQLRGPKVALRRVEGDAALAGKSQGAFRLGLNAAGGVEIVAKDDLGLLYGSFALLARIEAGDRLDGLNVVDAPALPLRLINHWDNVKGDVERGYAGRSIFDWWRLPGYLDQRLVDYARANASIGVNGVVVNNVNASALMLTDGYIAKLKRVADAWRPYGQRVYVSARFSAPKEIGGLPKSDPLDPAVRAWWKARADAIYAAIPDFGGFLVKANSEGQPGPQDYGRSHADGANMLAQAVGARGTVIWRAFVYASSASTDRANLAYDEFKPLDGQFASNVIVQVKNGPIDFQPREPFHPLFGAMPKTRLMMEVQITKEYLGQGTHLAYLAPMWSEVLEAQTGHDGKKVADVLPAGGMAGVANVGSDRNWSGTHFDQANWYAFGRLAWNPALGAEALAKEWAALTFSRDPRFLAIAGRMMMPSRQAAVDFMTPLGLTHQMSTSGHYGPGPWTNDLARPEWNPTYYSRADAAGIGFDRTGKGSNALARYTPSVAAQWADPTKIDENYLLWFHHVPWDFRMKSGRSLWAELIARYDRGVASVEAMGKEWEGAAPFVDAQRFRDTQEFLEIQRADAVLWRDASIVYFASVSKLPLPIGVRPPAHDLAWYKAITYPDAPGQ